MNKIEHNGKLISIIHREDEWKKGLDFLTPDETFIQAGTWYYDANRVLNAHKHNKYQREVTQTQETVILMSGSLRVDFYDDNETIFRSEVLKKGDVCVILDVGHGYEILEDDTRVVEVKNGPFYSVEKDKTMVNSAVANG